MRAVVALTTYCTLADSTASFRIVPHDTPLFGNPEQVDGEMAGNAPFAGALTPASTSIVAGCQRSRKRLNTRTAALVDSVA